MKPFVMGEFCWLKSVGSYFKGVLKIMKIAGVWQLLATNVKWAWLMPKCHHCWCGDCSAVNRCEGKNANEDVIFWKNSQKAYRYSSGRSL